MIKYEGTVAIPRIPVKLRSRADTVPPEE